VTPERWREIQALFNAALERAPEEDRVTFLREACGDDAALLAELESLLRADASGASVLDTRADRALGLAAASPGPGARVGPYELLGSIGTGGMGEVFLARRAEGGFDQRVAIKLIRPDAGSAQVLGRFTRERRPARAEATSGAARRPWSR
jgi:serine/threonine-protein kinase